MNPLLKTILRTISFVVILANNSYSQGTCCCGTPKELDFPGFDFEFPPDPLPGWFNAYAAGEIMGTWDVTKGFVDHVDKHHYYDTGYGNPNGPSTFVDLFGSPSYAGSASGAINYILTGLTPGFHYILEFYYSKFDVPGNFIATIKVANGNWLNANITATNPGNIIWLKASYNFVAQATSTNLEFIDAGSSSGSGVGVLIDDIKLFECPNDKSKPVVNNPPVDHEVECEQYIPPVPTLDIADNCDADPKITFKENKEIIDNCTKKLTREWTITDACGNSATQKQIVDIIDKIPPTFHASPSNYSVLCDANVIDEFNNWIKKRGNAIARDECTAVNWRINYDHLPANACDSVLVEFIAEDECGNQASEFGYFIVRDTSNLKFIIEAQDKNYGNIPGIRDSLREWLIHYGFSKTKSSCDSLVLSSNFNGDSSQNPIQVTFYVKDKCGNIDSSSASFSYQANGLTCCCGTPVEMNFPGLDFEFAPDPPVGGFINYQTGIPMGSWNVTSGAVDHVDKNHFMNSGYGNPNGPSNFIDLYGSPGSPGTIQYVLYGLTPGYNYTIEFYYACFDLPGNYTAVLKIANGAWLNVSWKATNPGNVIWLKASYNFTATSSSANLEFTDTGGTTQYGGIGVLIDDIKIFECPADNTKPMVSNPPVDDEVECEQNIPPVPILEITDNCDLNPIISFKEKTEIIDNCTKKITRDWKITDACGNVTTEEQIIDIIDKSPPQFNTLPVDQIVLCNSDVVSAFNDWIKKRGNALAMDECTMVSWRINYDHPPVKKCDSIIVEFIAEDECGNQAAEYAYFIVGDTSKSKFIIEAQNKNYGNIPGIRDSLREWLANHGFSKLIVPLCDTILLSSNFNGDSSQNPMHVTFYAKDRCGNIDSTTAIFSYQGGPTCCCGVAQELYFDGFDFEISPAPAPAGFFYYVAGNSMGQWNVTNGAVDIGDKAYCGFLSGGNPNGASNFMDLFGSPPTGSVAGTVEYLLTGLTPGNNYTIEFWYATFTANGNFSANLKIANGAWLNVNWSANNPGASLWLKKSYTFIATATSATLSFMDTGASSPTYQIGMLIDDIKIFECPGDLEKPVVNNPPDDLEVECDQDVPVVQTLDISDNCDLNPAVIFKETKDVIDLCTKKITREWTIQDACGNITTQNQIIDIIDKTQPQFTKFPENKIVYCENDVMKEFDDWIKKNGNAVATDACGQVSWRTVFTNIPKNACDSISANFIAIDHCGLENVESAFFIVKDTTAPKFIIKPIDKNFSCSPYIKDSLQSWLTYFGYATTSSDCDTVMLSHNFDGDSSKNIIAVTFYSKDRCGNVDSSLATFSYRNSNDTFHVTTFSCTYSANSTDTLKYFANGCDSIVIHTKIRKLSDSTYFQYNTCDSLQKAFDTIRLINSAGCDSLVFNEYILHQSVITNIQKTDCAYTQSSRDTVVLQGQYCDSLVITEIIPGRNDSSSVILNTCDITKADTNFLNLKNTLGCDSIVTVYTIYSPQQMTFLDKKICGLPMSFMDTVKFTTGLCDSLVITTYTTLPLDTTYLQSSTCDKLKAGQFSNKLINRFGCDSLVIETILLSPTDTITISQSTCILSQSGINTEQFKNRFGCDSIVQTITRFIPSDTTHIFQNTCIASQAKQDTLIFTTGACDSTVFRSIIFIPADTTQITQTTCNPATSGLSTLFLQNSNGCDSIILINTHFVPLHLEFELDSITCFNQIDGIFRILNASDFAKPFQLILNNQIIGNQNQISNLNPGNYEVFIRDQNGCITDSILFTFNNPPELLIDLGDDLEVKKGTRINLNLQSNRTLSSIFWNPSNLTTCNNCSQVNFTVDQDIWIYTQVIDDRNCSQSDSIFIRVKKTGSVYAPNSFSPNGDNINDYFYIQGVDNAIVETLFIYNRWGEKIFETQNVPVNDPASGWDGSFNSQKMNPGVFVFYAKVRIKDQEVIELKGDLTLIK